MAVAWSPRTRHFQISPVCGGCAAWDRARLAVHAQYVVQAVCVIYVVRTTCLATFEFAHICVAHVVSAHCAIYGMLQASRSFMLEPSQPGCSQEYRCRNRSLRAHHCRRDVLRVSCQSTNTIELSAVICIEYHATEVLFCGTRALENWKCHLRGNLKKVKRVDTEKLTTGHGIYRILIYRLKRLQVFIDGTVAQRRRWALQRSGV